MNSNGARIDGRAFCCEVVWSGRNNPGLVGQKLFFTTPSGVKTITSLCFVLCPAFVSAAILERLLRKGNAVGAIPSRLRMLRRVNIIFIPRGVPCVVLFEEGAEGPTHTS
jgi:hypothetical protein